MKQYTHTIRPLIFCLGVLTFLVIPGCSLNNQELQSYFKSQCSGHSDSSQCNSLSKVHGTEFSVGIQSEPVQPQAQNPSSEKIIIKNNYHDHYKHHHHKEKNTGHGSKKWGCLSNQFGNQSCGYGCVEDRFDTEKIYCGAKPGDNCATDQMGNTKCGMDCVATEMNSITCDKERYSGSSAHP